MDKKIFFRKGILGLIVLSVTTLFAIYYAILSQKSGVEFLGVKDRDFLANLSWSPTGENIAVISYNDGTNVSKIYLLDVATREFHKIQETTYGSITAIRWSPDGKQILFSSSDGGKEFKGGMWLYAIDEHTSPQYLTDGYLADWSPLGDKIAVFKIVRQSKNWDISLHVLTLASSSDEIIYKAKGKYIHGLSWSPDGTHIVFAFSPESQLDRVDIFVLNLANGELQQLTTSGRNTSPAWSPSGNLIAYTVEGTGIESQLYIMDFSNKCRMVIPNIKTANAPTWSPDGRYIAFIRDIRGIYKVDISTENSIFDDCP